MLVCHVHRTPPRAGYRHFNRHPRRRPGQRAHGIPDRPLQDRVDKPRRPRCGLADVELGIAEWVDWFNNQRLHTAIGDIPPCEHETNHYARNQSQPAAEAKQPDSTQLGTVRSLHRSRSGSN
ncbi:integrase core domain-containing protein [Streptomyces sp. NPDC002701]|uniref:integrase core domain-containing protein n=1 Tax=Streptomyces sp. NPDC002701 TaxID=3364661 RepID=UPI0036B1ED24